MFAKLPLSLGFQAEHPVLEMLCCYKVYWLIEDYVQLQHGQEYLILKKQKDNYIVSNTSTQITTTYCVQVYTFKRSFSGKHKPRQLIVQYYPL